jgi:hypothetical protein
MITISYEEAAIRGDLNIHKIKELASLGYFKTSDTLLSGRRIDQDSFDQYLANQKPIAQVQKEMIIRKKETLNMKETVSAPNGKQLDKLTRYGWSVKGKRGVPKDIPKNQIRIDLTYQREPTIGKVQKIQSEFNWPAFGRIMVSSRKDGFFYVFDGGHRLTATMSRSDIKNIPCDVFIFDSIQEEASAFRDANINRKPMSIFHRYHAGLVANDRDTLYIDAILKKNGVRLLQKVDSPLSFKAIGACYRMVQDSPEDFEVAVSVTAELCKNYPIYEHLLGGLFYLQRNIPGGLNNQSLKKKILKIGPDALLQAAHAAISYNRKSGQKVWADGMLKEINKNRHNEFKYKEGVSE